MGIFLFVLLFHFFVDIVIVREIPTNDKRNVCLWIKEKEGKLNHLPNWTANPKQGLLGDEYTFGKTELFCDTLS